MLRRFLGLAVLYSALQAGATPDSLIPSNSFSEDTDPLPMAPLEYTNPLPTPSVRELDLSDASNSSDPYNCVLETQYAPGDVITLNVRITDPKLNIQAVSAIFFGQKIALKEFSDRVWLAHYYLPSDTPAGKYFVKLFLKGTPSVNLTEKLDFAVDYKIGAVQVAGNQSVSLSNIEEVITLKPGEQFNPIKLEVNRQRILDLGYFQKVSAVTSVSGNTRTVKYFVSENPVISQINVLGSIEFSQEELLQRLELKPGQVLANRQLQKDMVALEKFYREKDYLFFRILSVERPSAANKNRLIYRVDEGHVRNIEIVGNSVTQRYVISREMDMKSGDVFNGGKLREDLRRIYNLNYFSTVVPDLKFNEDDGQVDVKIKVEEKKTSSINFGGGYGQIQGWFGFVDLYLDNIMGTAQSTLLKAQFGERITSYQFKYHNPWMWDRKTSFDLKLWSTYGYNFLTGDRELRNGWSPSIGFQRSLYVKETYTYRYEDVSNFGDRSQDYLDRAVGYAISYDDRDQWMNPTKGSYDVFSMDHSTRLLGGTINASRYSLQANRFYPLAEHQVFATRGMYNYQLGDIFPAEQYYVGSDNTVRGYKYIFAKGNERWVFNFEYRYIFTEMFVGVLFYDIGQAVKPVYDPLDEDRNFTNHHGWGSGTGFGLRIITPMGPIRLDYAWPQYYEFADGFFSFNMGQVF